MARLGWVVPAILLCFAGCATTTSSEPPPAEPEGGDSELEDPAIEAADSMMDDEAMGDEAMGDEEAEDSEPEAASSLPAPTPRKECKDVTEEDRCKITVGCAWSSDKKCVDE